MAAQEAGGGEAAAGGRVGVGAFSRLVRRTPLVAAPAMSEPSADVPPDGAGSVWLKLESLQRTASFKLRGACLRLDALTDEERARGVVAASAGNHGLGVALAGRELGIRVEVIVPETSAMVKRNGIAAFGAEVRVGGPTYDAAEAAARARAEETGAVFVSPFDDPHVIRGNGGTLAEEILSQLPEVEQVVCPVGGGGLIGGLAEVLAPKGVRVVGVQPRSNCAMHESLALGSALTRYDGAPTIAEGCEGAVAESTYHLCRAHGVGVVLVSEAAIREAMRFAYERLGLIVEASAAVALAGLRERAVLPSEATVVVVSGGNVDAELLDGVLRGH